ncbi:mannonate dehydratase [Salpingoeca rosetta]|uniref:mannonate dehydratase n=1 Tax=Salpingoeca rosetta (strain ATCC 50818 / BSB-021) TaxID=946362 RepID=F2TX75_SALR5|nr:mannonate dehydratase [Salpingoeca rosetta]EGD75984.1 mannonate dehydratase [Salpingoeca rosetta]|eukprot:XP_004998159.1 mannonate dehydratase [Salpingoeca rosetta]
MAGIKYCNWTGATPRIASVLTPLNDKNLRLAAQIGVTDVVYYDMDAMPDTVEELVALRQQCEAYNLRLSAIEGGPPMDLIVQGKPGRDEQLEHFKKCIRAMGEAQIPILCAAGYNFMPWSFRVGRTSYEVPIRGGALSSEWKWSDFDDSVRTAEGETTHEDMWANFEYFLKAVVPVAEAAGVYLACHPDDPPFPRIRGLARIMTTPDAFERMCSIVDSPHNGITFCQGCFSEMGVDIPDTIKRLGHRVHFVHFRDVKGNAQDGFVETFQDDGQTDMHAALAAWRDVGFNGIIRPDHVPLLPDFEHAHADEEKARGYTSGKASGYTMVGRIFAVGYMRALFQAVFGKERGSHSQQALRPDT